MQRCDQRTPATFVWIEIEQPYFIYIAVIQNGTRNINSSGGKLYGLYAAVHLFVYFWVKNERVRPINNC